MSFNYSWGWGKSGSCGARQNCYTKTVTTYTSDGRQITTTYQGNQPIPQVCNTTTNSCTSTSEPSPTQQATTSSTSQEGFSQFELDCLDEHNTLRARHGCPPLTLNRNLCSFAKEWARYLSSRNTLQHRSNNKYGENLYMSMGMEVNGRTAVRSWYDEIKSYSFGYGGFSMSTGHFTQVVWKNSRELGIAFEKRGNTTYVVANYDPPGNYSGQFAENVPPPQR